MARARHACLCGKTTDGCPDRMTFSSNRSNGWVGKGAMRWTVTAYWHRECWEKWVARCEAERAEADAKLKAMLAEVMKEKTNG